MNEVSSFAIESPVPARFTVAEFEQLCATGVFGDSKLELVDGVIIRMNVPLPIHLLFQRQIYNKLNAIFGEGLDGRVAMFEMGVQLGHSTWRQIDVAIANGLQPSGRFFEGRDVFLAVEIANSSLQYDLIDKRSDYAQAAIAHYWVVDPAKRVVHVMSAPDGDDYMDRRRIEFGVAIPVPGTTETTAIG